MDAPSQATTGNSASIVETRTSQTNATSYQPSKTGWLFFVNREGAFNCLGANHMTKTCYSKGRCALCRKEHHASICNAASSIETSDPDRATSVRERELIQNTTNNVLRHPAETHIGTTQLSCIRTNILLQSAVAQLASDTNTCPGQLLFDTGSQRSFVTKRMSDSLKLKTARKEILDVTVFGSRESQRHEYDTVPLKLVTKHEEIIISVLVVPSIFPPIKSTPPRQEDYPEYPGCRDLMEVDVLIGNDYYGHLVTGEMMKCGDQGLIAINRKVGWLLSGPLSPDTNLHHSKTTCHMVDIATSDEKLNELLPKLWELDKAGSSDHSPNIDQVLREFTNSIEYNNAAGRYIVRFPWKENKYQLPSKFGLSHKRLISLKRSLDKRDPELMVKYNHHIQDQLKLGFIERVTDVETHTGVLHYIPHLLVFKHDSATTKMRIVYDASAKTSNDALSLNDCLRTGPNLLQELTGILIKFRFHPFAFTADIEKAFLQIELNAEDRDATRFLWLRDIKQSAHDNGNLEVFRFCRVLFGAAPSPFLLGATIHHHLDREGNDWIAQDLKGTMYMDNVVTGTASDTQAVEYYAHSRALLYHAGVNLLQWTTNSKLLRDQVRHDDTGAASIVKVLGLLWDSDTDTLTLSLKAVLEETKDLPTVTKRGVLSVVASIFDPLGFVEPFIVKAKIMIQELWTQKLSWDETLSIFLERKWRTWIDDIKRLSAVVVPRPYFAPIQGKLQLHLFCDSSPVAYGAVAYLRKESPTRSHTALLMAKSRVASVKQKTLPFLELLAALLGACLCKYITDQLSDKMAFDTFLWSDSQIVLTWISSQKPLPQRVMGKITAIRDITSCHTWLYCPSSDNPADLLTHGVFSQFLVGNTQWFRGPPWLTSHEHEWLAWHRSTKADFHELDNYDQSTTVQVGATAAHSGLLEIIDLNRYSSLNKTVRVTALILRFIEICQHSTTSSRPLSSSDLTRAKNRLIYDTQQCHYTGTIPFLSANAHTTNRKPPIIQQLGLYLADDGLNRCKGRLANADLFLNTKNPILLPRNSRLTELIVLAAHASVLHNGVRETLTEIRQTYWIPQGRQLIKKLLHKCVTCMRAEGRPFSSVSPPPLPKGRVTGERPFQVTGVDFARALFVQGFAKGQSKMYLCLFTCASIRAVHLELVEDLTAESFVRAFRSSISRRGTPECMISDNAKTFKASSNIIAASVDQFKTSASTSRFFADRGITWHFIVARAPWWGRFYERLIGMTKRCLKKSSARRL